MTQPFAGVRILDFTRVLAGPFASQQLALLGADVTKIEPRGGDDMRFNAASPEWAAKGTSPGFLAVNSDKRSLTLDLKHPDGLAIARRLAAKADVVMENFRPGVMASLGLGYEALSELNPRLIYCTISGFGHTGPERTTAAYDGMIQAMSGLMSITGHPETGPTRAGFAACDVISGMTGAFAIASALFQRTHTGRGQFVDVAMLDATLNFLRMQVVEHLAAGRIHTLPGNLSVTRKPTADLYPTKDGFLVLAVLTDAQFERLCRAIERPAILADPRFADWGLRIANSGALREIIVDALATDTAANWAERLKAVDAPCGRVWSIAEIVRHPQLESRDLLQPVAGAYGDLTQVGTGFRLEHGHGRARHGAPSLGEHTDAVLADAGYTPAEISAFRAAEVV